MPPRVAVISVGELSRRLKRAVEGATDGEWVEGEVASLRRAPSGHVYFLLKDERGDAVVDCVMYRFNAMRAGRVLAEGARVHLRGRATVYAPRGRLQWVAEAARPAGRGALLEALERLKRKLTEEGLFDPARKRPLPEEPRIVGVVTSRSGAAIHDICTVAFRRGSVRLVLSNALVQGDGAAASIILALDRLEGYPGLDAIIVGRGGGSVEDLMVFNDERVVRRVARVTVPVVSAVGHEVDTTLTDLVADVRAATPSQAAELVVPSAREREAILRRHERNLGRALRFALAEARARVDRLERDLGDPRFLIADRQQQLDELSARIERVMRRQQTERRGRLDGAHRRLLSRHPRTVLANARAELAPMRGRLDAALRRRLDHAAGQLAARASSLNALSPLGILGRGYALALGPDGRAVRDATRLRAGDRVSVRVKRGAFVAQVREVTSTVENAPDFDQESPPDRVHRTRTREK